MDYVLCKDLRMDFVLNYFKSESDRVQVSEKLKHYCDATL